MKNLLTTTAIGILLSTSAMASDLALLIGNEDYDALSDVRRGDDMVDAEDVFDDLGFETIAQSDASTVETEAALVDFLAEAQGADRILVALSGRFVHSSQDTWLLPVDTDETQTLRDLPRQAIALSTILSVLSTHPGKAVLVLGTDPEPEEDAGAFLSTGLGTIHPPQGVMVIQGSAQSTAAFVEDQISKEGRQIVSAADRANLSVSGYAPTDFTFVIKKPDDPSITAPDEGLSAAEDAYWQATTETDSAAAYEGYLSRYPNGTHATEAKSRIDAIRSEPNRDDRLAEEALSLNRNARREIQRDLSLLDYNTRGIDGIFGPGSRNAVKAWQRDNGMAATSYLTRDQISQLDAQAERRAAELEAEAEARRAQQEAADRAFWAETGSRGDEAGLRAYLKRHPDGVFAEVAQERLDVIEAGKREAAAAQDRAAWDTATTADTEAAYRDYLAAFPQGAFVEDANARLSELTEDDENAEEIAAAQAREAALNLNTLTKRLIEERLDGFGLKPGPADGTFDDDTRRAIRRYQTARELEPTGYLTQDAIVRLLADSILR